MQSYWDGTCIVGWPSWGAVLKAPGLKLQGAKPLLRSIALTLAVSSLPLQPDDAVHSLKKGSRTKTNFSKILSKPFSGLQNLAMEVNLSQRFG